MATKQPILLVITMIFGVVIGAVVSSFFEKNHAENNKGENKLTAVDENKPLYWVAPMDANFRRDKPGKSPMGMDLIPVFAESTTANSAGTVSISAEVVNNLGVRTSEVLNQPAYSEIIALGKVQFNEDKIVHIHPRVEGWVESLLVKAVGEQVKQGQPLYTLYSPQLVNAQEEFILAIKRKNKDLIAAAKSRLLALQLTTDFIKTLEQQLAVQNNITFYAPQSGFVENLTIREGFYVKPDTTMLSIAQLDDIWVEVDVFERDASFMKPQLTVVMTSDHLPNKQWHGKVDYIYPTLDAKTRTLKVRLKFANNNGELKPNMFVKVVIHTPPEKVLMVPTEAVIRTGHQNRVVLALGNGQFRSVVVSLGRKSLYTNAVAEQQEMSHNAVNNSVQNTSNASNKITNHQTFIEILAGLSAGDIVVTSAQFLLDSESSKSADFKRMLPRENTTMLNMEQMSNATEVQRATVSGVINTFDTATRVINISRAAIEKWQRPAATLDFMLADTLDITQLEEGMLVTFTFEIHDDFIITEIHPNKQLMPEHHQHTNN